MSVVRNTHAAGEALHGAPKEPFERYLEDALGRFYEEVLEAPLPPEIAGLAERLEAQISEPESGDRSE